MIRLQDILQEWTGTGWSACRQWFSHRQKFISGSGSAKISISRSAWSGFTLTYTGPATGISISHATQSTGDTLHQLFNVLICEINLWLSDVQVKPQINLIVSQCKQQDDKTYKMTIHVPCLPDAESWQMNQRGGWGHDPGVASITNITPAVESREIYTEITKVPGHGNITTHFAAYPLADS